MDISVKRKQDEPKLVAVIDENLKTVFIRDETNSFNINGGCFKLRFGKISSKTTCSLEQLTKDSCFTPVYEGDEVTLKF